MRTSPCNVALLVVGLVAGFVVGVLLASHTGLVNKASYSSINPAASNTTNSLGEIIKRIQSLIEVTPSIRDKALSILVDMARRHSIIANYSVSLATGERYCVPLSLYKGNRYHLVLYSNASVDIILRGEDTEQLLITLAKRYEKWLGVTRSGSYEVCIEPENSARLRILVEAWPPSNISNDPVFKALAIALWSAENLHYVSDPQGLDYVASPEETLRTLSGDCDDFAVLLASMYTSVGLRSAVALIDTNKDSVPDHAAAIVELPYSIAELRNKVPAVLQPLGASYDGFTAAQIGNRTWLVIDPAMAYQGKEPWLVTKQYYKILYIVQPKMAARKP